MSSGLRVFISSMIAFIANFGWAYWVNSMMTDEIMGLLRFALVQGVYSGFMTAGFTFLLEKAIFIMRNKNIPIALWGPIPPMLIQSSSVILINLLNRTPNLWMTVAPSIIFSAIYGYLYTLSLLRNERDN
jgi:hypothetical protein